MPHVEHVEHPQQMRRRRDLLPARPVGRIRRIGEPRRIDGMKVAIDLGRAQDGHVTPSYHRLLNLGRLPVLTVTRDMVLPTTITGSYPRPLWFDRNLDGRSFKSALGDSLFREQYLDAVASIIAEQEAAGLDIVTDGDSRFDLTVGGKSWFFYPIERLGGIDGHRDTSRGWMSRHGLRPGKILWEVQEAYQPGVVRKKLTRGPLEYTELWKVAQRLTDKPVKFGAICAPALASMLWDEHYRDDRALITDLCDIMNAEFRELAAAGCPIIQVEEPPHHGRTTRPDCTDADLEF